MGIIWCRRRWYPVWILRLIISRYSQKGGRAGILRCSLCEVNLWRKDCTCSLCKIAIMLLVFAVMSNYSRLFAVLTLKCANVHLQVWAYFYGTSFRYVNMCGCATHMHFLSGSYSFLCVCVCVSLCTRRCSFLVLALVLCKCKCVFFQISVCGFCITAQFFCYRSHFNNLLTSN